MKKRCLSFLLSLCLCLSLLPTAALAAEGTHSDHCVCGNSSTAVNGHTHDISAPTWTAWTETNSLPSSGSYYLTEDVHLSTSHTIASGTTLNLCLNGHTVTYQSASSSYGVAEIKGMLNLCDCSTVERTYTSENYKLTGGAVMSSSDGPYLNDSNAVLTLYSGNIVGCGETGVYVGKGSFTMYGGEIVGCKDRGVYTTTNGFFTMHGGSIHHNSSSQNSAGVYASTSFTMTGGSITNNNSSGSGYVGGVYFSSSLTLSGAPVIKDNTINGNAGNLYLKEEVTIGTNGLTDGASIGVTAEMSYSGPREADITNSNDADYSSYFFADDPNTYHIENTVEGTSQVVKLAVGAASATHEHSWTYAAMDKDDDYEQETIVATCNGDGTCDAANTELTIIAPLHEQVNDGNAPEATFANNATSVGGVEALPAIMYQQTATSYPYDPIGAPTATPPTGAGRFEASITVEGEKAYVVYLIEKHDRENIEQFTVSDITNNSFVITLDEADRGKSDFVCEISSDYIEFAPDASGKATITVPEAYAGHGNLWVYVYQKETETHKKSNTKDITVNLLPATPTPADTPSIGTDLSTTEVTYDKDAAATALGITASVTDGGTLTYQWYKNDEANTITPTLIDDATEASYTPATSATGSAYYYCVVTNTKDGATATATTNIAKITITEGFVPSTYTVTYDANGGTGTIVDSTQYEANASVTLKSGDGLSKDGYTFVSWNTAANGTGTTYTVGSTYTITADTIFYAQWTENSVPIPTAPPIYIPVHTCTSKCDVCGGCEDEKCSFRACKDKCVLLDMNFTDVADGKWYTEAVEYVYHRGMMEGIGSNLFDINGTTTRAMIVTILWRLEGEPVVNYLMQFEDVSAETWYTKAVRWATSERIVEGYSDTAFGPTDAITREQFATILWRYAKYKGYDVSVGENTNILSYEDALSIGEWAIPAMQWACGSGLMKGDGVKLMPKADATRTQAAALFQRFCENVAAQ